MRALYLTIILIALAMLGSCSSSRHAAAPADTAPADTAWHTLYAPVKVSVSSPMSLSASGRATMVRDSLVHISMRFFGMEVAQLRATADSAWLVDRYHKIYTSMPLAELTAASGMTLASVQDILLGQASLTELLPVASGRVAVEATGYVGSPAGQVASLVEIAAKVRRRDIAGSLRWDFSKARWDAPVDPGWAVPAAYRRISPDELISTLKTL